MTVFFCRDCVFTHPGSAQHHAVLRAICIVWFLVDLYSCISLFRLAVSDVIHPICVESGLESESGLCAAQSSSSTPNSLIHVFKDITLCTNAHSCRNRTRPTPNCSYKFDIMKLSNTCPKCLENILYYTKYTKALMVLFMWEYL